MSLSGHNNVTIRPAHEDDIPYVLSLLEDICSLHCEGRPDIFKLGTKYSREELGRIFTDDKTPVFIAEVEGAVMGYVFCMIKQYRGHAVMRDRLTVYIDDLCVDRRMRGQGIGRLLFGAVKAYAAEIGAYNIDLNVWSFNKGALRFYGSLGMKPSRQTMEFIIKPSAKPDDID